MQLVRGEGTYPLRLLPHLVQLRYPELHRLLIIRTARPGLVHLPGILSRHGTRPETQNRGEPLQLHAEAETESRLPAAKQRAVGDCGPEPARHVTERGGLFWNRCTLGNVVKSWLCP